MIHPNTEMRFISPEIGYGVFATTFIPCGTIVYIKDPMEIAVSPIQYAQLNEPLKSTIEKYSYIDENGDRIVSWDHGKYVNHCCDCNTMSTGYGFEIAIKDIQPGEEITDEYGMFNLEYEMVLSCSKPACRKMVKGDDMLQYFAAWDEKVMKALKRSRQVEQPLMPLIDKHTLQQVDDFLSDETEYVSVRRLSHQHKLNHQPIYYNLK